MPKEKVFGNIFGGKSIPLSLSEKKHQLTAENKQISVLSDFWVKFHGTMYFTKEADAVWTFLDLLDAINRLGLTVNEATNILVGYCNDFSQKKQLITYDDVIAEMAATKKSDFEEVMKKMQTVPNGNQEIREYVKEKKVALWEIANILGISEASMTRKMRARLTTAEIAEIKDIADKLAESKKGDGYEQNTINHG